jgi:hypothetical protein
MVQRVATVAFEGIEARAVDVQVQVAPGLPAFNILWTIDSLLYLRNDASPSQSASLFVHPDVD